MKERDKVSGPQDSCDNGTMRAQTSSWMQGGQTFRTAERTSLTIRYSGSRGNRWADLGGSLWFVRGWTTLLVQSICAKHLCKASVQSTSKAHHD